MRYLNVGVMGHVDSGKTSLVRVLSTKLSTAALDKHPASKARGITLDLGFSCVEVPGKDGDRNVVTLVDCPGHASLLRTIISGARIIDVLLLVIDASKGIQTQTAECVVIGEVTKVQSVLVILNKIDLQDSSSVDGVERQVRKVLSKTKLPIADVLRVAAAPTNGDPPQGIDPLLTKLHAMMEGLPAPECRPSVEATDQEWSPDKVVLAVDHCFPLKGHGTILTGTVLHGCVRVGTELEIPCVAAGFTRKVKTIQSFRQNVTFAEKGARIGVAVAQLGSTPERFFAVSPIGSAQSAKTLLTTVEAVSYYPSYLRSHERFHLHVGHDVTMARLELLSASSNQTLMPSLPPLREQELQFEPELRCSAKRMYAVLELERHLSVVDASIVIGMKLDADLSLRTCRIAFSGEVVEVLAEGWREQLRIYKNKQKVGTVDRVVDRREAICRGLFAKGRRVNDFVGMVVQVGAESSENGADGELLEDAVDRSAGEGSKEVAWVEAKVEGLFGKSGKVRLVATTAGMGRGFCPEHEGQKVVLQYRKFSPMDGRKRFVQR